MRSEIIEIQRSWNVKFDHEYFVSRTLAISARALSKSIAVRTI